MVNTAVPWILWVRFCWLFWNLPGIFLFSFCCCCDFLPFASFHLLKLHILPTTPMFNVNAGCPSERNWSNQKLLPKVPLPKVSCCCFVVGHGIWTSEMLWLESCCFFLWCSSSEVSSCIWFCWLKASWRNMIFTSFFTDPATFDFDKALVKFVCFCNGSIRLHFSLQLQRGWR